MVIFGSQLIKRSTFNGLTAPFYNSLFHTPVQFIQESDTDFYTSLAGI